MPSRTTKLQVNHLVPRGEIKLQHGRQMKNSQTVHLNNSKCLANQPKPLKPKLTIEKKLKQNQIKDLLQMRQKSLEGRKDKKVIKKFVKERPQSKALA